MGKGASWGLKLNIAAAIALAASGPDELLVRIGGPENIGGGKEGAVE